MALITTMLRLNFSEVKNVDYYGEQMFTFHFSLISYYYLHCSIFPFLTHCDYCTDSFDHLDSELQYRLESKRFQKDLEKTWPKLGYRKKEKNLLDFAGTTL